MSRAAHARLAELYRELAKVHAELAVAPDAEWVDQHRSPLGIRLHCRLVRSGAIAGYRIGRRYLAKVVDVNAYIESRRILPTEPDIGTEDEDERLLAEIGGSKDAA